MAATSATGAAGPDSGISCDVVKQGLLSRHELTPFRSAIKPRYYVLLPKFLAYFGKPADVTVLEGRLVSDFDHPSLSKLRNHGASIPLYLVKEVTIDLTEVVLILEDRNTERFHAANADDAKEWYDVIKRCVESAHADPAGHRRSSVVGGAAVTPDGKVMTQMKTQMTRLSLNARRVSVMATSAITSMPQPPVVVQTFEKLEDKVAFVVNERAQILSKVRASTVRALDAASVSTQRRKESVDEGASESGSAAAASRSSEVSAAIARKRASYTTTPFPGSLESSLSYKNGLGHDAAVLSGWLTRPSKGTLAAGQRERYFVLTPLYLAYFTTEKDAGIVNGYLTGKCGLKSTSMFSQEGVGWALETLVGVSSFEDAEKDRIQVRRERLAARAEIAKSKAGGKAAAWSESDEEDEDGPKKSRDAVPAGPRVEDAAAFHAKKSTARSFLGSLGSVFVKKPAEEPTLEDSIRLDALAPDAKNTLIELDLGQRSVLLQAWNIANRDCWIKHLTDWSGLRRRTVENSVGFSSRSLVPVGAK